MNEINRIMFVESRDGVAGAIAFCKQTMIAYRAALAHKTPSRAKQGFARDSLYRAKFVLSMIAFRKYLRDHNVR